MSTIIFLAAVFLVIVAYRHGVVQSKGRLARRFSNRKDMSLNDFYDLFYKSSGIKKELIEEQLNHVAFELPLPATRLLPSDRFDVELAPDKGWNLIQATAFLEASFKIGQSRKVP